MDIVRPSFVISAQSPSIISKKTGKSEFVFAIITFLSTVVRVSFVQLMVCVEPIIFASNGMRLVTSSPPVEMTKYALYSPRLLGLQVTVTELSSIPQVFVMLSLLSVNILLSPSISNLIPPGSE